MRGNSKSAQLPTTDSPRAGSGQRKISGRIGHPVRAAFRPHIEVVDQLGSGRVPELEDDVLALVRDATAKAELGQTKEGTV